jgi:hypothetical protein
MRRCLYLFGAFFLLAGNSLSAEEPPPGEAHSGLGGRAVVLDISARVVEQNQVEIWNESHRRLTIPGSPVGIRMVGANVVVVAQFTPYLRKGGQNLLVAQGQIWVEIPDEGIRYQSTIQTIPIDFDEPIYFFPLGSSDNEDSARIEIMLTMKVYTETPAGAADTTANAGKSGN